MGERAVQSPYSSGNKGTPRAPRGQGRFRQSRGHKQHRQPQSRELSQSGQGLERSLMWRARHMKAWSWGWRGRGGGLLESRADIAYYTDWVASTKDMYFLPGLEAGSLRSRNRQVWFFLSFSPWLADGRLLLCPLGDFPLCACAPGVSLYIQNFSACKDSSQIRLGPTLTASLQFNHLVKDPLSKYHHLQRYWG